ncbi:MAG: type II toxin-antitoxin system RelE/ParE family toxin [Snowella sp.]|nr:type II toxin-antitoxin system RelE/ParE family toxin [Snowella sp.]
MSYSVNFKPAALRQLRKLSPSLQKTIISTIETLAEQPRPDGCKKLKGSPSYYRIRVSKDYRVIYSIQDAELIIIVIKIGHRKDIYQ